MLPARVVRLALSRKVETWKVLLFAMAFLACSSIYYSPLQRPLALGGTLESQQLDYPVRLLDARQLLADSEVIAPLKKQQDDIYKLLADLQQEAANRHDRLLKRVEDISGRTQIVSSPQGPTKDPSKSMTPSTLQAGGSHSHHTFSRYEVTHDREVILERLRYWLPGNKRFPGRDPYLPPEDKGKYLLMGFDCGGFNNIRMSFELMVAFAALTGRTLILPPAKPFYMLDRGPMTREGEVGSVSSIQMYWNIDQETGLNKQISALTVQDFIAKEKETFPEIEKFENFTEKQFPEAQWYSFWREKYPSLLWRPFYEVLYFPDIKTVTEKAPAPYVKSITGNRVPVEYNATLRASDMIIFPPDCANGYRYLGLLASYAVVSDNEMNKAIFRLIRDNVHYVDQVFDIASRVVAELGMFGYVSMHVRRNDLQYKEEFVEAKDMLPGLSGLLNKHKSVKKLYISTDERSPDFFVPFKEAGYQVYTWYDFWNTSRTDALEGVEIPVKMVGQIEQVIAAMGKVFVGTRMSTFTSYIQRLRGYVDAPDKNIYYHRDKYEGDSYHDSTMLREPITPMQYIREYPELWSAELDDVSFS